MKLRRLLPLLLLAVVFAGPKPAKAQSPTPERKVTIEMIVTENGETTTKRVELDQADEQAIEDALREMGVLGEFKLDTDGEQVTIDIRRMAGDATQRAMDMTLWAQRMSDNSKPVGYLGVSTSPLDEEKQDRTKVPVKAGAHILEVMEDSPAKELGLLADDVIVSVDDKAIEGPRQLTEAIRAHAPGDKVKITWYRGAKKRTGEVVLAEKKRDAYAFQYGSGPAQRLNDSKWMEQTGEERAFLGVTPSEEGSESGAGIGSVEEGSAAEQMGMQVGDVVKSINGKVVADFNSLRGSIREMKPGDEATIVVLREGREVTLKGAMGGRPAMTRFRTMGDDMPGMRDFHFEGFLPEDREELRKEMEQLREEMRQLGRELGSEIRKEMRVTIAARSLSEEEKALLRARGVAGLDQELQLEDLRVFPNPASDRVWLRFTAPGRGDLRVLLHDATGERVYEESIMGFQGRYERAIDISDKAAGSYFIVIQQEGRAATAKVVKQ